MKIKNALVALAALSTVFSMAACTPAPAPEQAQAEATVQANILSSYTLGGSTFKEFKSAADPDTVIIAFDGYQSSGISKWKDPDVSVGKPQILAEYSNGTGSITEFKPATNKDITCVYIDAYKSGALTCG